MTKVEKLETILKLIGARFDKKENKNFKIDSTEITLVPKKHNVIVIEFKENFGVIGFTFPEIVITPEHIIYLNNDKDNKIDYYISIFESILNRFE